MTAYDVLFESCDGVLHKAHSFMLIHRCPKYFKDIEWDKEQTIIKVDYIGEIVEYFIHFVYNNTFPNVPNRHLVDFLSMSLQFDGPYERCVANLSSNVTDCWHNFNENELRKLACGVKDSRLMPVYLKYRQLTLNEWKCDEKSIEELTIGDFCEIKIDGNWCGVQVHDMEETKFYTEYQHTWFLKSDACIKGSHKMRVSNFVNGVRLHTLSCENAFLNFRMCTCSYEIKKIV
jgi:hypothetical protein